MEDHLLLDLKGCDRQALDDLEFLKGMFYTCSNEFHSSVQDIPVANETFHRFQPQGISGMIWVNGVCFLFHTWPEYNYASIDILTYNEKIKAEAVAQSIIEKLAPKQSSIRKLRREF